MSLSGPCAINPEITAADVDAGRNVGQICFSYVTYEEIFCRSAVGKLIIFCLKNRVEIALAPHFGNGTSFLFDK